MAAGLHPQACHSPAALWKQSWCPAGGHLLCGPELPTATESPALSAPAHPWMDLWPQDGERGKLGSAAPHCSR